MLVFSKKLPNFCGEFRFSGLDDFFAREERWFMGEIDLAWAELCEYVAGTDEQDRGAHAVAQRRQTIAVLLGYSDKQLKKMIEEGAVPVSERAREAILSLYRQTSRFIDPHWHLARSVSALLNKEAEDFSALRHYAEQKFKAYRLGGDDRFIIGDFEITSEGGRLPLMHYHASRQAIGDADHSFRHSGPIFNNLNRMYCLGVGALPTDTYFRAMIFRMVEHPRTMVTFGMVLTEHYEDDLPMAAKTALVHEEHPQRDDAKFLDALELGLRSNGAYEHILIGTKKMPAI